MVFHSNKCIKCLLSIMVILFATQTWAATLVYEGDQLMGVSGVESLGNTWDVSFVDGSYQDVYPAADPTFLGNQADAQIAATALIENLIALNTPLDIKAINGCGPGGFPWCDILTVFSFSGSTMQAYKSTLASGGWLGGAVPGVTNTSTTEAAERTIATWTVSTVPIPGAVWLFGSGLVGLIGFARRKQP